MIPQACRETVLDRTCRHHVCAEDAGHDGDHVSVRGYRWEPPRATLARLRARWEHTHHVAWTGSYWVATAHDRSAPHRSHVEPTPEQLERKLREQPEHPWVLAQLSRHNHSRETR
ncbi:hypothetical protein [Nocardiopsis sp. CNS-639]|uniref:hypothetical protein n=1 Tax=Nocardiopsis sp. CNS-639 TaxID=1169153 RepID=UPI0003793537|nr:hypothetical protein [Nocardiopsis sp. CNS-639]